MGSAPNELSLVEMAALVRSRTLSPLELVDAHLAAIERVNPRINAFVRVLAEQARDQARRAGDEAPRGPLHGVPVTIKDCFDVAGLPTLYGSRFRLGHKADADATAVARLKAAGAIILGKTNVPEYLASYDTDNFVTGRTNNPHDVERTAGGSSGGEAAAIAAYCSAGGLGSDGGGSIRVPAHFCGIAGLKPTLHRVPATGHYPPIIYPSGLLGAAGPLARSVADVRALFNVMQGYDDQDSMSTPATPAPENVSGMRIGVMEQFYQSPVQPAVRDAVRRAARVLGGLGFTVDGFTPGGLERAPNVWAFLFGDMVAPRTREYLAGREAEAHWTVTEFLRDSPPPGAMAILDAFEAREAMRAGLLRQMRDVSVLLLPVCSITAFKHRERRFDAGGKPIGLFQAMMCTTTFNLLGLPALTVPFGKDEYGLPVGVQLVGRPWEDERILEIGVRLENA